MISISSILTIIIIISTIRFVSVFDTLKTNIEIIFRPGISVNTVYFSSKIIFALVAIIAIIYFIKILKNTDSKIKNSFFYLLLFYYIVFALSQRNVFQYYSYLYVLQAYNVKFVDIIPLLEQDLFFEEPYIFWFVLLMVGVFYFLKSKNYQEYALPLWVIPFGFLYFPLNSVYILYGIAILAVSIYGMKYGKRFSSIYYFLFQLLINVIIIIYAFKTSIYDNKITLLYSLEILFIFFIPSFCLLLFCIRKNKEETLAVTWMLPAITFLLVAMPLHKSELNNCLSISSSIINSFLFLGNIPISVSIILLLTFICSKINLKLKNLSFYSLSIFFISYYILDSILYHYSHFRINQQTLVWTMNMDNIFETTLKTCLNYINIETWFIIVVSIIIISFLLKKSNKLFLKQTNFRFSFFALLISAQISCLLLPIVSRVNLSELQDPFYSMVKGIELFNKSKGLSDEEIKAGFLECEIPIKEYKDSEPSSGNGYNCILVTLESVHWRYLDLFCEDKKTWPNMNKYKDRMEIFPNFYSCFPESTTGDITVLSGLQVFTPEYIQKKNSIFCPTIVDELKKLNYETYLFASGSLIDGNLISIVKSMHFDNIFAYKSSTVKNMDDYWYWGMKEGKTVDNIIDFLSGRDNKKPYFVWYRTVYPHAPFTVFEKPQELVFKTDNILIKNMVIDYKNCLIYLDKQFSKLVEGIDKLDKKTNRKTIIFFVTDHGEMLGEKDNFGLFGHGLYAQSKLTNCPCIILYPNANGLKINKKFGSQIDVLPTMLDCLDIKPSVKRYEFGESLIDNIDNSRPIYLSSAKSYAIVEDGYYYYYIDKKHPQCIIEKIDIDENHKAVFERTDIQDKEVVLEKYNRLKKYFELQEEFSLKY